MPKRFTSGILTVCLFAGACSSLPGPTSNDRAPAPVSQTERETAAASNPAAVSPEATTLSASDSIQPGSPIPPLESGNEALFKRAIDLMVQGNLNAAEVLLLELTASQPELAGPWTNLAHVHVARGEPEDARRSLEKAIAANPQNCEALTLMGVLARRHGLFTEAETYYKRCIAAQPFFASAHLNLGILYELYMGRLGEALAAYNEYQAIMPEPDVKVAGWVMDLERRVASVARR